MGDRTTCRVYVLKEHEARAIELIKPEEGEPGDTGAFFVGSDAHPEIVALYYYDVNYASIDALDEFLAEGIAYDFDWDQGSDFTQGESHLRFTAEGEAVFTSDSPENPSGYLTSIEKALNSLTSVNEVRACLVQIKAKHVPLPWDNQVEYGKVYRARKLIQP